MADALRRLSESGVRIGLWPLLDDADGYWPSETNADRFARRVEDALSFAERAGAPAKTLAIDLEPPLEVTRRLMGGDVAAVASLLGRGLADAVLPFGRGPRERRMRRDGALGAYRAIVESLERRGVETIAAIVAPLVLDVASGEPLWEWIFETPFEAIGFSVVSPMLYTSELRTLFPFLGARGARALLHACASLLRAHAKDVKPSVSLGLVSTGKLGDERCFRDPVELLLDVEATLASGIDDLALFSLEGILERGPPERWLVPYTNARPRKPVGPSRPAMSALVRALAWSARVLGAAR